MLDAFGTVIQYGQRLAPYSRLLTGRGEGAARLPFLTRDVPVATFAAELGMALDDYQSLLGKVRGTQLVYLEDMSGDEGDSDYLDRHVADTDADPLARLNDRRMREALVEAIKGLPEREQYVMSMYYEHDMNLKEIAAVLGVTESRVCQLHSQSIARLRAKLRAW